MAENLWESTRAILQSGDDPVVRKPKLTDQLLQRPPFRFLHDVITAVQNKTGFAPGLFAGDELDSKGFKDKDSKVAYLTKIIDVVGTFLETPVPAKPLKIVAGLEPEKTNAFLQMLGRACQLGDAQETVQKVLGGERQSESSSTVQRPDIGRPSSRPSSQHSARLSRQNSNVSENGGERGGANAGPSLAPPPSHQPNPSLPPDPPTASHSFPEEPPVEQRASGAGDEQPPREPDEPEVVRPPDQSANPAAVGSSKSPAPRPPARGSQRRSSGGDELLQSKPHAPDLEPLGDHPGAEAANTLGIDQGATPFMSDNKKPPISRRPQRPQSAKRAPPKVKSKDQPLRKATPSVPVRPPTSSSNRSGSPQPRPSQAKLFVEGEESDDDVDVEVLTQVENLPAPGQASNSQSGGGAGGGALVKDILEVEQRLVDEGQSDRAEESGPADQGIVLQRRRRTNDNASNKQGDLSRIRNMVQSVCQSVTPLGRCLEFLQEDVDAMAKEARFWATERKVYQERLDQAQNVSGEDLNSLESQIQEMDDQIHQAKDRIVAAKAQLLLNHETIVKLLNAVSSKGR